MATKAELEERIDTVERRVALLEARLRGLHRQRQLPHSDDFTNDRARLGHIIRILRRLGGAATLDAIARANDTITKAGTRAQLMRLVETGDVENSSRGFYALVRH